MAKTKTPQGNVNILPHNPLKAEHKPHFGPMEVFNHVKGLKGDKQGWYQFDLETLLKRFPDDKVLKQAYADLMESQKAPAAPVKVTKADKQVAAAVVSNRKVEKTAAKKAVPPAPQVKGNTRGKKTAAELKAAKEKSKGKDSPATEQSPKDTADELASIK